jgi:hypothetical protein
MKKIFIFILFLALTGALAAQTPQFYNYTTQGIANSFPFNQAAGKMAQWIILPGEYSQPTPAIAGTITKFYFFCAPTYPLNSTYTQFYIRMGRTALTNLPTGQFYNGPMDTVFYRASGYNINVQASNWWEFILDNPFIYYPDSSLIIEIGQCSSTQGTGFSAMQQNTVPQQKLYSVGGCPFVYSGAQTSRTLNSGITVEPVGISNNNNQAPFVYKLEQNYPNPFNPVTKISFTIPKAGHVILKVNDILGREVAVIVDGYRPAGSHNVEFNAENLPSGIYLYSIESGDFKDTKKMTLIK